MALQHNPAAAPLMGRSVLISPRRRITLAAAGHPLATVAPTTKLGHVALNLAAQASIATVQIITTTTYVNALTALAAPVITFQSPPPNTQGITVQQLQSAYQGFVQQLASLQGSAQNWVATSGSTGQVGVLTNLVTVAQTLAGLNQTMQGNFSLLQTLQQGSPAWQSVMAQTQALVSAEAGALSSLSSQISALGTTLNSAASTLVASTSTGVLSQLLAAYNNEIAALSNDIAECNNTIGSDNAKIAGLGFGASVGIVVGIIGLFNLWNPLGWLMLAGGAAGAYFAIAEIETLKGEVALLEQKIKNDQSQISADQMAANLVSAFSNSAVNAANMNSAAQQELNTLVQLCNTLGSDIQTALTDLKDNDITDAISEWNLIMQETAFLAGITAYIWPSSISLANPTMLTVTGQTALLVSNSGAVYQYTSGGNTWTALPGYSLSVVSAGGTVVGIDGAPINGTAVSPTSYGQSFFVKTLSGGQWNTISTFPAAQVATDGKGGIWAINQTTNNRQAYQYLGSGTNWSALPALGTSDAPSAIAAYNGTPFVIANNGGGLWSLSAGNWVQIGNATYSRLTANGGWLGLVDTSGNAWAVNVQTAGSYTPVATATNVAVLAQASNGDQYYTDQSLNLWYRAADGSITSQLKSGIVNVTVSDGDSVYANDNQGNTWVLTNLAANTWQQLPALPTT